MMYPYIQQYVLINMKNKNLGKTTNKEFDHRPTIHGNKTTTGNLPNVEIYDNERSKEQKIQRRENMTEMSKHMSLMFPWDLYIQLVEYSKEKEISITDITVEALKQYLVKTNQNNEIEKLKEKVKKLEKDRSGGEHEFDNLETTIKNIVQKESEF
jgi:hypothetical protein